MSICTDSQARFPTDVIVVKLYNTPTHCQKGCTTFGHAPLKSKLLWFSPTKPTNQNLLYNLPIHCPTGYTTQPSCTTSWIIYGPLYSCGLFAALLSRLLSLLWRAFLKLCFTYFLHFVLLFYSFLIHVIGFSKQICFQSFLKLVNVFTVFNYHW